MRDLQPVPLYGLCHGQRHHRLPRNVVKLMQGAKHLILLFIIHFLHKKFGGDSGRNYVRENSITTWTTTPPCCISCARATQQRTQLTGTRSVRIRQFRFLWRKLCQFEERASDKQRSAISPNRWTFSDIERCMANCRPPSEAVGPFSSHHQSALRIWIL